MNMYVYMKMCINKLNLITKMLQASKSIQLNVNKNTSACCLENIRLFSFKLKSNTMKLK